MSLNFGPPPELHLWGLCGRCVPPFAIATAMAVWIAKASDSRLTDWKRGKHQKLSTKRIVTPWSKCKHYRSTAICKRPRRTGVSEQWRHSKVWLTSHAFFFFIIIVSFSWTNFSCQFFEQLLRANAKAKSKPNFPSAWIVTTFNEPNTWMSKTVNFPLVTHPKVLMQIQIWYSFLRNGREREHTHTEQPCKVCLNAENYFTFLWKFLSFMTKIDVRQIERIFFMTIKGTLNYFHRGAICSCHSQ